MGKNGKYVTGVHLNIIMYLRLLMFDVMSCFLTSTLRLPKITRVSHEHFLPNFMCGYFFFAQYIFNRKMAKSQIFPINYNWLNHFLPVLEEKKKKT